MLREINRVYTHILTKPGAAETRQELVDFFKAGYNDHDFTRSYCHVNDELTALDLPPIWERNPKEAAYMMRLHIFKTHRMSQHYGGTWPGDTYESFLDAYNKEN